MPDTLQAVLRFIKHYHPKELLVTGGSGAGQTDEIFTVAGLMDVVLRKLNEMKEVIEESLTARSPLQRYKDVEKELEERWEDELKAAIEAEYHDEVARDEEALGRPHEARGELETAVALDPTAERRFRLGLSRRCRMPGRG